MHRMGKPILLALVMMMIVTVPVLAADPDADGFMQLGSGARAAAMADSFAALADDASASYWNPAGLAAVPTVSFSLSYANLYTGHGLHYGLTSIAVPFGKNTIGVYGLGFWPSSVAPATLVGDHPSLTGVVGDSTYAFGLAYGRQLGDYVRVGITGKGSWHEAGGILYRGFGFDVGTQVKIPLLFTDKAETDENSTEVQEVKTDYGQVTFGVMARDLYAVQYPEGGVAVHPYFKPVLAVAYQTPDKLLAVESDMQFTFTDKIEVDWSAGAEIRVNDYLNLRAGIEDTYLTLGLGLAYEGISLDYAYKMAGLGTPDPANPVEQVGSHVITAGYRF